MTQLGDEAKKKYNDYNYKCDKLMSTFSHNAQKVITASRCDKENNKKCTDEVISLYNNSGCVKPSDFLKTLCPEIHEKWIREDFCEDFFWCIDNVIKWPIYNPFSNISGRDSDYSRHMYTIGKIIEEFHKFSLFDYPVNALIMHADMNDIDEELYSYYGFFLYAAVSRLSHGDRNIEKLLSDSLKREGEYCVSVISCSRAIFMSNNSELVEKVIDFILTSGIQEGGRLFASLETLWGTEENFLFMFKFFIEKNMLRFPSVKSAVVTWINFHKILAFTNLSAPLLDYSEFLKISDQVYSLIDEKLMNNLYESLTSLQMRQKFLTSENPVELYIALTSIGIHSYSEACEKAFEILKNSTDIQKIAIYYFLISADRADQSAAAKYIFENYSDNFLLLSYYNVFYLINSSAHNAVYEVCINKDHERYDTRQLNAAPKIKPDIEFSSLKEACHHYDLLMKIYDRMDKKKYEFKPVGFPWHDLSINRSQILEKLCIIANMTDDDARIEECAAKISEVSVQTDTNYQTNRDVYLYLLLARPKNNNQKKLLFSYIADRDNKTRRAALMLIKQYEVPDNDVLPVLEDALRFKSADIRNNVMTLIYAYPDNEQEAIIGRLLNDKKSEKRACGLDMLLRLSKDNERTELFSKCTKYISAIGKPSEAEKVIIDQINSNGSNTEDIPDVPEYRIYDPSNISFPEYKFDEEDKKKFCSIFTNSVLVEESERVKDNGKSIELLKELDRIFEENSKYEYTAYDGTVYLLGNNIMRTDQNKKMIDAVPLSDVWKNFYSEKICSYEMLVKMYVYLIEDRNEIFKDKAYKLYGSEYSQCIKLKYRWHVCVIVEMLLNNDYDAQTYGYIAKTVIQYILEYLDAKDRLSVIRYDNITCFNTDLYMKLINMYQMSCQRPEKGEDKNEFKNYYRISVLANKIMSTDYPDYRLRYLGIFDNNRLPVEDNIMAYAEGLINKDTLYYSICKARRNEIESFSRDYKFICMHRQDPSYKLSQNDKIILSAYEFIVPKMVDEELRRGESESDFSQVLMSIGIVNGVKTFVRILLGMENDKFQRGRHYHYNNEFVSKNESFSHLMSICYPDKGETSEDLKRELRGHKIPQKRLIEASLYAPCEWIDIIGDYLGWKGYVSCCYYFIAHMNEYNGGRTGAVIAKYTPLQEQELRDGAFDIDWFRDAYSTIGEERFRIIYDAAKYITDGGKHTRARKFADAVNGKIDKDKIRKEVEEKRNRDTLLAYMLIALKDENEAKERYLYLHQFLKESKKFGSLKRTNEADAVAAAMGNLSRNAGYTNLTRFKLKMENLFIKETSEYFGWHECDDVRVRISVGENGKASVSVMKDEKILKSLPASMKKNDHILELKQLCTKITDQYRRTKIMFERSMEEKSQYSAAELSELHHNPAAAPIVDNLVFRSDDVMGFVNEGILTDCYGNKTILKDSDMLVPVHCYDLWKSGKWHDYQKYVFDNKIIQPFKQVFRELYVKTDEELEQTYTERYRGMPFRAKIASGCLNSRDWVYDYENGMQKVYYCGNIIATVNAEPYWFVSFGTEDPSFGKIEFYDRKLGEKLRIKDVPDMVFSEIMRDLDLAVSVAYSGDTDPETSTSTMEVRRSVAEFTMQLFKIKNVTFEKHHAFIKGRLAEYSLHLGSGIVHILGGPQINIYSVRSYNKNKLFIPFEDDDNKTAEIISKIVLLSEDSKIRDPLIIEQIMRK